MKRSRLVLTIAAGLLAAAPAFSQDGKAGGDQPLPTDPALVTGELPNGMKYIVRKHGNPPGRAAMWIHIGTGSLNEKDNERGISHYLEHMAFNGSENFPPGSVINYFQSMGLNFGRDQNAFTSFDQTTYQLAMPDNKPETIEKGMKFFADVAGRLSLLQTEVDSERQVILEEKRTRVGPEQRMQEYIFDRLAPGSIIGKRLPIGVEDTLLKLNRDDFVGYYSRWYTPSNATLMVVADADPQQVVEEIKKNFSFGDKVPVPAPQDPGVKPTKGVSAIVATDPEYTRCEVAMNIVGAKEPPATTRALARRDMVRSVATTAFNRRMGAKISKGGTAYLSASASSSQLFRAGTMQSADARGKPEEWRKLLTELGEDVQRARLHGFTAQEIEDVKKEIVSELEDLVTRESTLPAGVMLRRMNGSIADGEPIMSAKQELELARDLLPGITVEEVSRTFKQLFDPANAVFVAQLPSTANPPTEAELVSLGQAAFSVTPEKQADEARASTLLDKLPEPGTLSEKAVHEASQVESAWLSNGARFHHRYMDQEKGQAAIVITLAAGDIQETDANRGVSDAAALAWGRPATGKLSSTQVRDLMTGTKVSVRGGIGRDEATIRIDGNPSELEQGLKLAYLMLTDPKVEPAALEQWKQRQLQEIEGRKTQPRGVMTEAMADTIYAGCDSRVHPLTAEQVNRVTLEAAQSWLTRMIATAPMEISVVGEIERPRAEELVARYLGSLPKRERIGTGTLDELRKLNRQPGPRTTWREVKTRTDQAVVVCGFYGADQENLFDTRCMNMNSIILSTRMIEEVREKQALAYSPRCTNQPGIEFPGFGVFLLLTTTDPGKSDRLVEAVTKIYEDYEKNGPTEDELTTAKKQITNTLDDQLKHMQFWSGRLAAMDYRGVKLDEVVNAIAENQKLTAEQLKQVFDKYYTPEARMTIVIKPSADSAEPGKADKADKPETKGQ